MRPLTLAVLGLGAVVGTSSCGATAPSAIRPLVSPIVEFSQGCAGQNAEVEQAVDPVRGYVYEEWMGCNNQIGFAASADDGQHFGKPVVLAGSLNAWDPSVAVAPDGTAYAAFMTSATSRAFPVVEASFDHGRTFPQVTDLVPSTPDNWGDRDFIAVGPTGTVYLTWDYGPSAKDVRSICRKAGSCSFAAGDVNIVVQRSTKGGLSWGPMTDVSPGFPASGADSAPLLIRPDGRIYAEYQGYQVTSRTTFTLTTAHSFAISSADGGTTWSAPTRIGPARLTMNSTEWWIDGDISADTAGNLYVTWDTQSGGRDVGWLSYSTDNGTRWSPPLRVTPDTDDATHIVEVTGGRRSVAYVGWLADNSPGGYALYLRQFTITRGWVTPPIQVSQSYGDSSIWPGDTFGISTEPGLRAGPQAGWPRVVVSWGSAVGVAGLAAVSQDRATVVTWPPAGS